MNSGSNLDDEFFTQSELVLPCHIKGILHSHSNRTDGAHSLARMARIADEIGLEYLGISDHFHSKAHPCGLDQETFRAQREDVDLLRKTLSDVEIFHGVELDANLDGTLPLDPDTLALFDYVIVSFPETENLTLSQFTTLVEQVTTHPQVTILGRPIGDLILRPNNGLLDMDRVLAVAAASRTVIEVNANPTSPTLDWNYCLKAQEMGVKMAISPNAHRAARLVDYRHGAQLAHDAGLYCDSFLNTLNIEQLRSYLAVTF